MRQDLSSSVTDEKHSSHETVKLGFTLLYQAEILAEIFTIQTECSTRKCLPMEEGEYLFLGALMQIQHNPHHTGIMIMTEARSKRRLLLPVFFILNSLRVDIFKKDQYTRFRTDNLRKRALHRARFPY